MDALTELMLDGGADADDVFDAFDELVRFLTEQVGLTRQQALEAIS